jgi:hypothetical protein
VTTATIDALMLDYAWTVHDFQHLANSLSLLTAAIGADEFEERNFYSDIEALTMAAAESPAHRALLDRLTAEDKADRLVYSFFVENRIDRDNADAVAVKAREKLNSLRADITEGRKVLDRAYAILAEFGEEA